VEQLLFPAEIVQFVALIVPVILNVVQVGGFVAPFAHGGNVLHAGGFVAPFAQGLKVVHVGGLFAPLAQGGNVLHVGGFVAPFAQEVNAQVLPFQLVPATQLALTVLFARVEPL
jgi:hypothetical protein